MHIAGKKYLRVTGSVTLGRIRYARQATTSNNIGVTMRSLASNGIQLSNVHSCSVIPATSTITPCKIRIKNAKSQSPFSILFNLRLASLNASSFRPAFFFTSLNQRFASALLPWRSAISPNAIIENR